MNVTDDNNKKNLRKVVHVFFLYLKNKNFLSEGIGQLSTIERY